MTTLRGTLLESLTWLEAVEFFQAEIPVVMALGAAAKEHGPHLRLNNDFIMAEYLKNRLLQDVEAVFAPSINCSYYPAFTEYAGSISLSSTTAENMVVEICQSLAKFGTRRFYIINTGISTLVPLKAAGLRLAAQGILLSYTNLKTVLPAVPGLTTQQEGGSHADELETSMMLYIDESCVDMTRAVKDFDPSEGKVLSPHKVDGAVHSPSGIWGDPTHATCEKGKLVVEFLLKQIVHDIEKLRDTPLAPEAV